MQTRLEFVCIWMSNMEQMYTTHSIMLNPFCIHAKRKRSIHVHVQYASKKPSHKRAVQQAPVLIKRGENGSARSNGRVYRVGNVEDQRRCCVFSGLGVLKQA